MTGRITSITGALLAVLAACFVCAEISAAQEGSPVSVTPQLHASDHQLTTNDYLLIQFFDGVKQTDYRVQVDSEGTITLPLVGKVSVSGLIPSAVADKLTFEFTTYYRQPVVSVQVLELGRFDVFVFGTNIPGQMYQANNGDQLLGLLQRIQDRSDIRNMGQYRRLHIVRGGFDFRQISTAELPPEINGTASTLATPSPTAVSRRQGQLEHYQNWRPWIDQRIADPDSEVIVIDALSLLLEGELAANNLELRDRDVVFLPAPEAFVTITGVARGGTYELLGDETLGDVLRLAGAVEYRHDLANAVVKRVDDCGRLERLIVNLVPALDDLSVIEDFPLRNRDEIVIAPRESRVFVLGEVLNPGAFDFQEDGTAVDYIAQCVLTPSAHTTWIAIIRQSRNRFDTDGPAEVIQVNFKDLHKGLLLEENTHVLPGDVIYVPPKGFEFNYNTLLRTVGTVATGFVAADNYNSNNTTTSSTE